MAISSNTLFHFFKEYKYLKQTIDEGIWARYFIEKKWNKRDLAIPMFCFCDIPLSQIKEHLSGYGNYGIGVTKQFAKNNFITPVAYISQESHLMNKLSYFLSSFEKPKTNHKDMEFEELMLYYAKKVSGYNSEDEVQYKFYNEREWRYIPKLSQDVHLEILLGEYDEKKTITEFSRRTESSKLELKPKDIAYIIVERECEVKEIAHTLQTRYRNYQQLEQLFSRIITVKQIKEDF